MVSDTAPGLHGVLAVLTPENSTSPVPAGVGGVEVRADLFSSREDCLDLVESFSGSTSVLFTPRHESQGGEWRGPEDERASYCLEAIERGASAVDLEHGTEAAEALLGAGHKVVLSWHNFQGMISKDELARLTLDMESVHPAAIKVVPTAGRLKDCVDILDWVNDRSPGGPPRVGFCMSEAGVASRILSLSRGAPWTYGAHGGGVAPGQPQARDLIDLYRAHRLDSDSRVFGVAGNPVGHSLSPQIHNPGLACAGINAVYIPLHLTSFSELDGCWDALGIDGLSVTIPFKLEALALADEIDDGARECGAANTLVRIKGEGELKLHGANTDFNGVLDPLTERLGDLSDLEVAIVGNGGAARGAVLALMQAGARPTLYFRDKERGGAVAGELGVQGRLIEDLGPGNTHKVIINATPLGLTPGDPSPIASDAFDPDKIAFDMVYDPPETSFLKEARSRGAETIGGDEMLVAQGLVQFKLFTGEQVSKEAFLSSLNEARAQRSE